MEHFSSTVGVVCLGGMAELRPAATVFSRPCHPYTQALLASASRPDPDHHAPADVIHGEIASAMAPPGCKYHQRCPHAVDLYKTAAPVERSLAPGQIVACHSGESLHPPRFSPA